MNQLTKLIEQYERENPGQKAKYIVTGLMYEQSEEWATDFVLWLASKITDSDTKSEEVAYVEVDPGER